MGKFEVTEEMAATLWDEYENRECDSPDTTQGHDRRWALQAFVDRYNLCQATASDRAAITSPAAESE